MEADILQSCKPKLFSQLGMLFYPLTLIVCGFHKMDAETFGERVICNSSGPIGSPVRCPHLTPLDFYLWGHVKNETYDFDPPENIQILE